jgi:hypothetical protein
MSGSDSDSDDSREYASIPTSPRIYSSHHSETEPTREDGENRDEESDSGKDKKPDVFRVLVTGFGVSSVQQVTAMVLIPSAVWSMASQPVLARSPAPAQSRSPNRPRKSPQGATR